VHHLNIAAKRLRLNKAAQAAYQHRA